MSYVIYNAKTFKRIKTSTGNETFANDRVAKGVLTKYLKASAKNDRCHTFKTELLKREDFVIASYDEWRAAEPMVETYNMLDPERKPFPIRASDKDTYMDPATERYHSM